MSSDSAAVGSALQIRFAAGERPHLFWISRWERGATEATRHKVLSKQLPDASLEVLVIEERISGRRRGIAREIVPAGQPAGWLTHWVSGLAGSLGTKFVEFDLRSVTTHEEWRRVAGRLGWTLGAEADAL